jgi:hypothetical protein
LTFSRNNHDSCGTEDITGREQLDDKKLSSHKNVISAEDAVHQAALWRNSILKHHAGLRECLTERQDNILKRWKGWKVPRRRPAISAVCPDMAPKGFVQDVLGKITNASTFRSEFLLFQIKIDELSGNYLALLELAHWRATTNPEDYVAFDWEQLRRGSDLNVFAKTFAEGCITMFGDGFGHLKPFDEVDVRCSDAFPTSAALLILERQSMIYKVLYTVISCLKNSNTVTKGSAEWNTLASRRF